MPLPSLMILDGELRNVMGAVRSLGHLGIPLMVGSSRPFGRSCFSKYVTNRFKYPPLESPIEVLHEAIIDRVRAWQPGVLLPVSPKVWSIIYAYFDEYEQLTRVVPCPDEQLFKGVSDKGRVAEYAELYRVPIPKTFRPKSQEEVIELCDKLPYPVLLKPRESFAGIGIRKVNRADELSEALCKFRDVPIIQEFIEGEDLELTILCFHGKSLAGSAYKSLHNAPLPYGPPVACKTIRNDVLMRMGIEFLEKLKYHGVAHLDFRVDNKDGQAKLIDFNPRLAGTNDISIRSGVDFVYMLYNLALGEKVEPCFNYEIGIEFRWLIEWWHLMKTKINYRTVLDLLRWRRVATEISITDPMPHIIIFYDVLQRVLKRLKSQNTEIVLSAE